MKLTKQPKQGANHYGQKVTLVDTKSKKHYRFGFITYIYYALLAPIKRLNK